MAEIQGSVEFQGVIAKFVEKMGFQIESSRILDDGSIDFRAQTVNPMGGKVASLIRASTYSRLVNANDIRDLHASMISAAAVRAAYITTSGFSDDAVEAARDKPISLINKYQLMDSLEKRGLVSDRTLMESLDKFGMAEQHFQGQEQSFAMGRTEDEAKKFFETKAKKGEKLAGLAVHYAPLTVLKVVTLKELVTEDQTLRSVEKKDYMFVNLNSLELYYILQKRKKNVTESMLMRSDIIKRINGLPDESKEHLLHLLDFGDLPIEDLQGKELSILKNKKVIEIYEGDKGSTAESLRELAEVFLEGMIETVIMVVDEIVSGISSMGEEREKPKKDEEKPKKKVTAVVNMPHLIGGIYDIWKYLEAVRGMKEEAETDPIVYSSNEVSRILKSVMKGKVRSEGIIFMPYYKGKYVELKTGNVKYEVLVAPRFKSLEPHGKKPETGKAAPKIKRRPVAGEFKLIR
jgi:hypothetical protein